MTTTAIPPLAAAPSPANSPADEMSSPIFLDVLRSEWTKLRSVKSTYWTLFAAAVATIGLGAILCATYVARYSHLTLSDKAKFDPTNFSLSGLLLAGLAVAVLGVLAITSEYGTGMIRSTFAAVPQRRLVLAGKAVVFASVTGVVGVVSCAVAFLVGQQILSGHHLQASLGNPGVARAVVGGGLYLAVLGLLALGLGTLIRHTAGAITAVFGLIFVLPALASALPTSLANSVNKYLPSNAGQAIYHVHTQANMLAPWAGFAVFCGYALVVLLAAAAVLKRRDA